MCKHSVIFSIVSLITHFKSYFNLMFKQLILLCALSMPLVSTAATAPFSGDITTDVLLNDYDKFNKQYNAFTPTEQDIALMQKLEGKALVVLFGTWCHDSQREVPKLIKLLDESKVKLASVKYVAVGFSITRTNSLPLSFTINVGVYCKSCASAIPASSCLL